MNQRITRIPPSRRPGRSWRRAARGGEGPSTSTRVYENRLKPIADAASRPILADYPQFVEPVREVARFEAPILVDDPGADLEVRAWRFSYNARGIIEVPNRLRADRTAVIVVHPWGIDDGQGWRTPEPAGVAFQCTPAKNQIVLDHAATVINPFLKALRGKVRAGGVQPPRHARTRSARSSIARSAASPASRNASRAGASSRPSSRRSATGPGRPRSLITSRPRRRRSTTSSSSPASTPGRLTTDPGSGSCRSP